MHQRPHHGDHGPDRGVARASSHGEAVARLQRHLPRSWLRLRIDLRDGRQADLSLSEISARCGDMTSWTLEEPTDGGVFKTTIGIARSTDVMAIACELDAGVPAQVVAPVFFEARCPHVVRSIIDAGPWLLGEYASIDPTT